MFVLSTNLCVKVNVDLQLSTCSSIIWASGLNEINDRMRRGLKLDLIILFLIVIRHLSGTIAFMKPYRCFIFVWMFVFTSNLRQSCLSL